MAFSYSEATGDGSTTVFPFSFSGGGNGYIRAEDIHVYISGVETEDFIFSGTNQVQFTTAPPAPEVIGSPNILIRRIVPKDVPYADFTRGNNFGQSQLNNTALQQLYVLHEFLDGFLPAGYFVKSDMDFKGNTLRNLGALDMQGSKITGLPDPTSPSDAVPLSFITDDFVALAQYADADATSAAASAVLAYASEIAALEYRDAALAALPEAYMVGSLYGPTTLELARTSALYQDKTIVVKSTLTEEQSNITAPWPSDRALKVEAGGCINPSASFTGLSYAEPWQFGAYNDNTHPTETTLAFQRALTAAYHVGVPAGTYSVTGLVQPNKQSKVVGVGNPRTGEVTINTTSAVGWDFPAANTLSRFTKLENMRIVAAGGTTGVRVANGGVNTDNVYVVGGAVGLQLANSVNANMQNSGFYGTSKGILAQETAVGHVVWQNTFKNVIASSYGGVPNSAIGLKVTSAITEFFKGNNFQTLIAENVSIAVQFDNAAVLVARGNTFLNLYSENVSDKYIDEGTHATNSNFNTWIDNRLITVGGGLANPVNASVYSPGSTRLVDSTLQASVVYANQIYFPVTQVPSGLPTILDDYKEGVWTPVINRNYGGWAGTYTSRIGTYIKIGRQVTLYGKVVIATITAASSTVNIIQGLPFTAGAGVVSGIGTVSTDSALTSQAKSVRVVGTDLFITDTAGAEVNENWLAGTIEFSVTYFAAN